MHKKYILKKKYKQIILSVLLLIVISVVSYKLYEYIQLMNAKVIIENYMNDNEIYFGENYQVVARPEKEKYKNKIVYKSADENIGIVDERGSVKTLVPGKLKIEVFVDGSHEKEVIELQVKEHEYDIIKPKEDELRATKNAKFIAYDKTMKKNATHVEWTSSKGDIARIDKEGKIKCLKPGDTKISIVSNGKVVKSIDIKVKNKEPKKIYSKNVIALNIKETQSLNSIVLPTNIKNTKLTYKIKDVGIASVENNKIIPKKAGKTVLEIFSEKEDTKYICEVNISNPFIEKGKYLSNNLLKQKGADSKNKLMIVAHPDDETLWGGGHLSEGGWFVVCLTNGNNSVRTREYNNVLNYYNAHGVILSYPDLTAGRKDNWKSVKSDIMKDLQVLLGYKNWSTIVTHNREGEYGHIHHKMTHQYTKNVAKMFKITSKLRYFGKYYDVGQVPATLQSNLSGTALERKIEGLKLYTSKQWSITNLWYQMLPHEHWTS